MLFLQEVIVISESVIWNLSREEIQEKVNKCNSICDMLEAFGYKRTSGSMARVMKNVISAYDIDISQRTIEVFDAASDSETNPGVSKLSTSYVLIKMKVLAPQWSDGTTAFMDAQYAGYIVAELKFT